MSVRQLADYLAASDRRRRSVIRDSKFRSTARVVQHDEARMTVTAHLSGGVQDPGALEAKAEFVRGKLPSDDFDKQINEHNADYIARFAQVSEEVTLPKKVVLSPAKKWPNVSIGGLAVAFSPNLQTSRVNNKNVPRQGALMLRYEKGKPLADKVGCIQSALIAGFMRFGLADEEADLVDPKLCLTLCAYSGKVHCGPGDSITIFNNAKAACETIAEQWEKIAAPPNAILA